MKFVKSSLTTATAVCTLLFSGCSMAPDYQRPVMPVSEVWPGGNSESELTHVSAIGWREFFDNPDLQILIETALVNNRDLLLAGLDVERLEAMYRIQKSTTLPDVNAAGSGTRQRVPADLSGTGSAITTNQFSVGAQIAAYEIDFFGRIRSLKDQALESYLASEEARRSYEIAIVSSVVRQYFALVAGGEQLTLTLKAEAAAKHAWQLNRELYDIGMGSELDLRSSEAQYQSYRASVSAMRQQVAQAENALVFLLGAPLPEGFEEADSLNAYDLEQLPVGLPSELLARRPDIRAAEHSLKAANAYIGAARAAFFPNITLTAFGGTASSELSNLFEDGSQMWSFTPSIVMPIFNSGRNKANLDIAHILKRMEIANYEKAIQTAFREVSDVLASLEFVDEQITAHGIRVEAAQRRFEIAGDLFDAGSASYLTVLLAQQELVASEQALVQVQLSRLMSLTNLFTALGGGWQSDTEAVTQTGA